MYIQLFAEPPKATESPKPTEPPKPTESPKPAEPPKPADDKDTKAYKELASAIKTLTERLKDVKKVDKETKKDGFYY